MWPRLCFYTCLWFCPQGGSPENPPPGPGRTPLGTKENPPDQADPPGTKENPPGTRQTPRDQGEPPQDQGDPPGPGRPPRQGEPPSSPGPGRHPPWQGESPPGRRLQHTVNERPVRILLECILVLKLFCWIYQIKWEFWKKKPDYLHY